MQRLKCILALSAELDDKFEYMGVPSNNLNYWKKFKVLLY